VIIKITEGPNGWGLWATATDNPDAPAAYAAMGRTPEQIQALLPVILGEAATPQPAVEARPADRDDLPTTNRKTGALDALAAMRAALDGWIEGARSNHDAVGRRGESRGEECWRTFAPADIRAMINDACREMGVAEFQAPSHPIEDAPWTI
jgi:hypothetical protein